MSYAFEVDVASKRIAIKSSLDPVRSHEVQQRFQAALQKLAREQETLSTEELLLLVALNTTQSLLETEAQVAYFLELLEYNGYSPKDK